MSIRIECLQCGSTHQVNDRLAGRRVRCPHCDAAVAVPEIPDPQEFADLSAEALAADGEPEAPEDEPAGKTDVAATAAQLAAALANTSSAADAAPPRFAGESADFADEPTTVSIHDLEEDDDELPRRKKREEEELDMTPMVDVTFLLLIFFMVTASFSLQKSIAMPRQTSDLPSTSNQEEPTEELDPIELEIDQYGAFLVLAPDWERETPGKQNLVTALKEAVGNNSEGMRLNIKVHEDAELQALVDGMDAGTIAGFTELQVVQVDGFD